MKNNSVKEWYKYSDGQAVADLIWLSLIGVATVAIANM
jgi:hypothetical protein